MDKILFIDTLATGMQLQRCGLYGIGGILTEYNIAGTVEIIRFEYRMRPFEKAKLVDSSLWIGGIGRTDLLHFENEKDVLKRFCKLLDRYVDVNNPNDKIYIAGYNSAALDAPFIREWFERNGNVNYRNYFRIQVLDVAGLATLALMDKRNEMSDFHLETVAKHLGIMTEKHREYMCVDNAETSLNIFRKISEEFKLADNKERNSLTETEKNY